MRGAFIRTLTELAEGDDRIIFLTGDLGFSVVEPFAERFPDRFVNAGVAEQNMVGVATGLAEAGMIPFVYSIATFASLRPYEFIRNGPILHQLPVRMVGVGGGFEYGHAGPTHHGVEDVGVMRLQHGLTVVAPADFEQAAEALRATWNLPGPVYYRLGKDDTNVVAGLEGRFELGRAQRIRAGTDALLLALGGLTPEVVAAADALAGSGIRCGVLVVASVVPAPVDDLVQALGEVPVAVTVEAHSVVGGIGSMAAEVIAEHGLGTRLVRCGVRVPHDGVGGSEAFLLARHGLGREAVAETVSKVLAEVGS